MNCESGKLKHKIHKNVYSILSQVRNNLGNFVEIGWIVKWECQSSRKIHAKKCWKLKCPIGHPRKFVTILQFER
jgi:hypothetical protein